MEPQKQVRAETLFPDFFFNVIGASLIRMLWGLRYPAPQNESTAQQWSQSG